MERIELSPEHVAAINRRRRTVVNYDSLCSLKPFICEGVEPDQLVAYSLSFFDTGNHNVDSIWWNFGEGNEAPYPSTILPRYRLLNYQQWFEQGIDIVRIYVDETRKRGYETFLSYRMNGSDSDYCSSFLKAQDFDTTINDDEMLPQKKEHPEWLIRSRVKETITKDDYLYVWNYAEEGVRKYRLECFRELADNYDVDGFELDFGRNIPYLPLNKQWEHREQLTEFVRSLRLMLLERAGKRGRPYLLAARVPDSIAGAKIDGMDLETWAQEHLVDIFVPGTRPIEVDMDGFRRITEGTHVKVYPCLDCHHNADGYGNAPAKVMRGVVSNWLSSGADGIQTFNFINLTRQGCRRFKPEQLIRGVGTWDPHMWERLNDFYAELGAPELLEGKDKTFVIGRRGGGHTYPKEIKEGRSLEEYMAIPSPDRWITPTRGYLNTNMFAQLPGTISNRPKVDTLLTMQVGDDVPAMSGRIAELKLRILLSDPAADELPADRRVEPALVRSSGQKLGPSYNLPPEQGIERQTEVRINGILLGEATVEDGWLSFEVHPRNVAFGNNVIGIRVNGREEAAEEITIEKVELDVTYL